LPLHRIIFYLTPDETTRLFALTVKGGPGEAGISLHIDLALPLFPPRARLALRWGEEEEQSEYRPQVGGLLSEAPAKGAREAAVLIRFLLFPEVLVHPLQLKSHRGHCLATRPAVFPHAGPLLLLDSPRAG